MSKYVDLFETILAYNDGAAIFETLVWLDRNPGQVPGRTITESELGEVARTHESIRDLVNLLGITIVPDPEPTNAERLAKLLEDNEQVGLEINESILLAALLDEAGVKAPTHD